MSVPAAWRRCCPTLDSAGWEALRQVLEHPDAPRWSHALGDRPIAEDLPVLDAFRARTDPEPLPALHARVRRWRETVPLYRERLPPGLHLARDWADVPILDRATLVARLADLIPDDADTTRMIVYTTTGTSGHALDVPSHPLTVAAAQLLGERAAIREVGPLPWRPGAVASVNVCAQRDTFTFATRSAAWGGALIAKINLFDPSWPTPGSAARFLAALAPPLLATDPLALDALLHLPLRPRAVLSTALMLHPRLQARAAAALGAPVIDLYASTETGPIAAGVGDLALLAPDLHVEVVDPEGRPLPDGEHGEIVVSGGRNPYLPLVRYRTGDRARLLTRADGTRALRDLEGRAAVVLRDAEGRPVNPVDVARTLRRDASFVQQRTEQAADGAVEVRLRPAGEPVDVARVTQGLRTLFGELPLLVRLDPTLGDERPGGKVIPFARAPDG